MLAEFVIGFALLIPRSEMSMKIVQAASEMFPLIKTGGLADVCGSLSRSLAAAGNEVAFFLPGYRDIIQSDLFAKGKLQRVLQIELGDSYLRGELWSVDLGERERLYVIRRDEFFDRQNPYGTRQRDYDDNDRRFVFFCKAVVESMRLLEIKADVLHCHDWQTGLLPLFLRFKEQESGVSLALKTFFSIHNLAFQGLFPRSSFGLTNLPEELDSIEGVEFYEQLSMMKAGIQFADKVLTVSPNYAREILTSEYGCGLEGGLKVREADLVGIANGIDTEVWNPGADKYIARNYDSDSLKSKMACQEALLEYAGLKKGKGPVFGMVARLTQQKGVEFVLRQLSLLVERDCRFIILGKGEPSFEKAFRKWEKTCPEHIAVCIELSEEVSHMIEAGSDFFLMPSVFEPCGLNQMYSQRYGTLPLVSRVGGLVDTVVDLTRSPDEGTGIGFEPEHASFKEGVLAALDLYADPARMEAAIKRAMAADFSWERVTALYLDLYRYAVGLVD